MDKKIIGQKKVLLDVNTVAKYSEHFRDDTYGYLHWMYVWDNCYTLFRKLARENKIDIISLELAAKMHDCARETDVVDFGKYCPCPDHAKEGAEFAMNILKWEKIGCNKDLIYMLIENHDKPNKDDDPIELKILKDANKLDLYRFGDILRVDELVLDASKKLVPSCKRKRGIVCP